MAKQELLQNWNGMQVLSNDHVPELEQEAYMQEAAGAPRDFAAQQVYQQYKRKHLIQAAAFHLKAMKAAQGMGAMQEAQKHMLTYGLCVQSLGLDPYGAVPPEIGAASQDPNMQIAYKFQAHPADAFLLGGGGAGQDPMQKSEPLVKAAIAFGRCHKTPEKGGRTCTRLNDHAGKCDPDYRACKHCGQPPNKGRCSTDFPGSNCEPHESQTLEKTMNKHEIGHEIYKVLKKATEVLEGAAQPNGDVPGKTEKSEFTNKIQAARTKVAHESRDEAGLSYHLNGPNAYSDKHQAKYKKLDAKNRREKARQMNKSDLSPFAKAELEAYDNGGPCNDCSKNPCKCEGEELSKSEFTDRIQAERAGAAKVAAGNAQSAKAFGFNVAASAQQTKANKLNAKNAKENARMNKDELDPEQKEGDEEGDGNPAPAAEGNGAPTQDAPKASSGAKGDAFSTTLTGADNAMGKPGSIPDVDFSTTLEGMDSDMKAGSIPNVPFSTTLEGTDAAGVEKSEFTDKLKAARDQKSGELKQEGDTVGALKMKTKNMRERGREMEKEEFQPTNFFNIKLKKHEILHGIHEIGKGLLMKMGAYDMAQAQDATNPQYFAQPQQNAHPYAALQGWTPAMTSVGHAAMKPADGGGVYSIHNIGSRHHVIHSDAQGNITPLGIHGDTRTASGTDLAMGAVAHHELMSRGGTGQVTGAAQGPAPLMRSEIAEIQMQLAPLYRDIRPLTKHDEKHNIKISRSMGGKRFMDEQGNIYNTLGEAAERLGLQASHIDEVLHGRRDQTNGHVFKFVDG